VSGVVLAEFLAPYDPNAQVLSERLTGPSTEHLFGTDLLGRDVLSRLMYGGQFSLAVASISLLITSVLGTLVGVVSARAGGFVDEILMRVVDILLSFPDVIVGLLLVFLLGPGPLTVIVALSVVGWTPFARLGRALTLTISTRDYIEAATALGCSESFILFRHVLPNVLSPLLALGMTRFGYQLIAVSGLSYLGVGVQPPASDWGSMLAEGQPYMRQVPSLVIVPGLTIFLTALAVMWLGKGRAPGRGRGPTSAQPVEHGQTM
jgi:peptide/nickel transport system permease protein